MRNRRSRSSGPAEFVSFLIEQSPLHLLCTLNRSHLSLRRRALRSQLARQLPGVVLREGEFALGDAFA